MEDKELSKEQLMQKLEGIYKKQKLYREEAERDTVLVKEKMETQFNNTLATVKWINRKLDWVTMLRLFEKQAHKKHRELHKFYTVESNFKLNTKDELNLYINTDDNYVSILDVVLATKTTIKYIEEIIEALKNKNFEQDRWLKFQNFINGK